MPGIKIVERDESFIPSAPVSNAFALIGISEKGLPFVPQLITNREELYNKYGVFKNNEYSLFAAEKILENTNAVYFSRLLGINAKLPLGEVAGFGSASGIEQSRRYPFNNSGEHVVVRSAAFVLKTGSDNVIPIMMIHVLDGNSIVISGTASGFKETTIEVKTGSTLLYKFDISFEKNSQKYYKKVMNFSPTLLFDKRYYVYLNYENNVNEIETKYKGGTNPYTSSIVANTQEINYISEYTHACTPFVISQNVGGVRYELFRFKSLFGGEWPNNNLKITITNIRTAQSPKMFPTFDVLLRRMDDNDRNMVVLESFMNCDLDPSSTNFIVRKVGNKFIDINGDETGEWANKSKYIIVETSSFVSEENTEVLRGLYPVGFAQYPKLHIYNFTSSSSLTGNVEQLPYIYNKKYENQFYSSEVCWGIAYNSSIIRFGTASGDPVYYVPSLSSCFDKFSDRFKMLPKGAYTGSNVEEDIKIDKFFTLENLSCSTSEVNTTPTILQKMNTVYNLTSGNYNLMSILNTDLAKFTFGFYGGFDGIDIHTNNFWGRIFETNSNKNILDTVQGTALKKSLELYDDPNTYDILFISYPGIINPLCIIELAEFASARKDCVAITDLFDGFTVNKVNNMADLSLSLLSNSYYAKYAPRVTTIYDNKHHVVPASCAALYVLAYSLKNAFPWSAPAGELRGNVDWAKDVVYNFKSEEDRRKLYEAGINLILRFASSSARRIVVWGQKTGQIEKSALDRLNVRLLRIYLAKEILKASRWMVFEGNNPETWDAFKNICKPIFDYVKQNGAVEYIYVQIDSDINTPQIIENNEMVARIVFKPVYVAEEFTIEFVISSKSLSVK